MGRNTEPIDVGGDPMRRAFMAKLARTEDGPTIVKPGSLVVMSARRVNPDEMLPGESQVDAIVRLGRAVVIREE